ncbi:MAG: EAL domain-containing protein, partial [Gammaproteobacteria bacterium]
DILNLPAGEMNEASLKAITDPDDWQAEAEEMEKLKAGKIRGYTLEKRHFRRNGSTIWVNLTVSPMWGPGEQPTHHIAVMEDITERKLSEESMQLASLVYENSCEGMAVTDADGNILNINPAFTEVTGYTEEEAIGKNPSILKSGRHDQAFFRAMWKSINTTGRWQGEIWNRRKSGEIFPEWLSINTIYNKDGTVHRRVALFSDITEKKKNDDLIWCQANFDPLTGLPNRNMFYGRLEEEIKKKRRNSLPLALLFLDLDYFKSINDSLGHDKGDNLLKDAARRIRSCVRETDVVARLGGDEFIVILENLGSVERVAQDVLEKLSEPFMLGDDRACVSASIGIALYPEDADNAEDLLRHADQAMYTAKAQGKNCFCYFTRSMREATLARMQLTDDMRLALADGQFRIHYQPIVDLKTSVVRKAEALVRWQHPARGMIGPNEFIEIAEETGMIIEIGDWIFREAAKQAACWRTKFRRDFQIGINKSAVQFYKNKDTGHAAWFEFLREQRLPFEGIVVEITEGLLLEVSEDVSDQLLEFRSEGIQVSLDDFGTGYSSLSYLKKLNIDYLKIDRSFIVDLENNKNHLALCEAIIVMAHKLRIKVVAEGIENQKQCDLLTAAGCDFGQGYLFSEPVPSEEFEKLFFSA